MVAIVLAVSAFAFPALNKAQEYHWYTRNANGTYSEDVVGENPSSGCLNGQDICAKGFLSARTPSTISDVTPADTPDRKFH